MGVFPAAFKTAVVKPVLEKGNLELSVLDGLRPLYLSDLLLSYQSSQILRSSGTGL